MSLDIQNMEWLRKLSPNNFDDLQQLGSKLYGALQSIQSGVRNIETQTNSDATNPPSTPPPIDNLQVKGQNGHFQVAITDNNEIYRGIKYYVEHADNANFSNPITVELGTSRNANLFLGNVTRYWRAYSAYGTSSPSPHIFHGGLTPTPVFGGGAVGGPSFLSSQGSGTGAAGIGLQGPGTVQYRSETGVLPVRSSPTPGTGVSMRSNGVKV